jgi:TolB-like protein/DNA-binding winged helix-turn-helix (wHTH) protein/Flp pilus assembly protein TadD
VLDPESGDLEGGGTRIRLQEQSVQVLRELIAHAGSVVPREQLIALLWPKGVVDFDTGLNTVIRKLRSALRDTSETPRYVETLPRRGYRFIGTLDPDPEATSAASAAAPVSAASGVSPTSVPPSHHEPTVLPEAALAEPKSMASVREPAAREVTSSTATTTASVLRPRLSARVLIAALAVVALLAGVYALWRARSGASVTSVRVEAPPQSGLLANVAATRVDVFTPPPHSIAVLPFVNISGDKEQEYFSDGLTEELLNSLAHVDGLQVAARTSSFTFREHPDIADVAHKLNVATVLEGSVRRSGHTVRVTAQLNNAVTGFHLWSNTYDRDLSDVLRLQTEIANAVANALKVTLLGDVAAKIELGGTRNPQAFDAYLRAAKHAAGVVEYAEDWQPALDAYTEAIRLDPAYALAFAGRSLAFSAYGGNAAYGVAAIRDSFAKAEADARRALALAPNLADGHLALASVLAIGSQDFVQSMREYDRALTLAPNNARILADYGRFMTYMGRTDEGIAAARRAVVLDPLNPLIHRRLGDAFYFGRHTADALGAYRDSVALQPDAPGGSAKIGLAYYTLGNLDSARSSCEMAPRHWLNQECLAIVYARLGRHADAEAMLAKLQAENGDDPAYNYAEIYSQWGNAASALQWLDRAVQLRDSGLIAPKVDPLMDPLRKEPRFQAVERALKFPD